MEPGFPKFDSNACRLLGEMAEACSRAGRNAAEVGLLPVTKTHPVSAVEISARFGFGGVGENRVQEGVAKRGEFEKVHGEGKLRWELIGHLQSNKAKLAAEHFDRIQSVDSERVLGELNKAAAMLGKKLAVLIQVNAGMDPAKFGVEPDKLPPVLERALACEHLRVEGFMAIAPLSEDRDVARRCFMNLREIRDRMSVQLGIELRELSMGMSGDFAEAIEAGSTQVRVGSALFGDRG